MGFLKAFLRNLLMLVVLGVVLYVMFPEMVGSMFQLYGMLFGPAAILILIVGALPRRRRR